MGVPVAIIRMVEFIIEQGLEVENIFLESGDAERVFEAQDALDDDAEFPSGLSRDIVGIASVAECLLRYLDCLIEPVIPRALFGRVSQIRGKAEAEEVRMRS